MANTFASIYLHIIFAVKYRDSKIDAFIRNKVYAYIGGVIRKYGHIPLSIGGIDNHIHILVSYNRNQLIPDLVKEIKTASTHYINTQTPCRCKFEWQRGYGIFSHSRRDLDDIIHYIQNQPQHHLNMSFREEYIKILDRCGIEHEDGFLPDDV